MTKKIIILPGDGIGPEIMAETMKVLEAVDKKFKLNLKFEEDCIGGSAIDKYGVPLANATLEKCRAADAVLMGSEDMTKISIVLAPMSVLPAIPWSFKQFGLKVITRPTWSSAMPMHKRFVALQRI